MVWNKECDAEVWAGVCVGKDGTAPLRAQNRHGGSWARGMVEICLGHGGLLASIETNQRRTHTRTAVVFATVPYFGVAVQPVREKGNRLDRL
jgi:hypothetical protein